MSSERVPLLDLTTCDREPITRLDRIQNFGFLVALSNDWTVVRASANLGLHIGIDAASAIGGSFRATVEADAEAAIRSRIPRLHSSGNERLFGIRLISDRTLFDLNLHFVDDILVIEGEPSVGDEIRDAAPMIRMMMGQLSKAPTPDAFLWAAAGQVREITGFDRVMVYRIAPSGNGEVVADSNGLGVESLVGLHYPGADIPKQAQALYLRNTFRITSDVGALPVPLLSTGTAMPLDLSQSITRAASPIHMEYLTNMGVSATLSISIIVDGKLWGLFTCHHFAPRLPSFVMRTAADLYGSVFSLALERRLMQASVAALDSARARTDVAFARIAANPDLLSTSEWLQSLVAELFDYDGMTIYLGGEAVCQGATPVAGGVAAIAQYLSLASPGRVFTTDQLTSISTLTPADLANAAGMLAIPISHLPGDYIMLFRREHVTSVNWGGDPGKFSSSEDGTSVSPRKSFKTFVETIHGKSRPFLDSDRRIGEAVRSGMVEVILNLSAASMSALAAEIEARRQVEREVFGLNEHFEAKVQERTGELNASNDRLQKKIVVGAAALKSSRAEVGSGLVDLLASETALASSKAEAKVGVADLLVSTTALASSQAQTRIGLADLLASETALASSQAQLRAGEASLLASQVALASSKAETEVGHADLLVSINALASSQAQTRSGLADLFASAAVLAASEADYKAGVADLLASAVALASSRAETEVSRANLMASARALAISRAEAKEGQSDLRDSEVAYKALSLANRLLVTNEAALGELVKRLEQFSAFAAHDLRSPIASMVSGLHLIGLDRETTLGPQSKKYIAEMIESAHGLARQITSTLIAARAEHENEIQMERVDLNVLVEQVRFNLSDLMRKTSATLHTARLPFLKVEPNLFRQLLQNLVENSINHRSERPPKVSICHTLSSTDNTLSVEDNGRGIDLKDMQRVFSAFETVQVDRSGTGIGLALCRRVVNLHQGSICIDRTFSDGCRVVIKIPKQSSQTLIGHAL